MFDPTVRAAIDEILRETILENWRFYGLIGAVSLLTSVVGNLVISYMKKRSETLATKADFEEILRQLRITTHVTEDVKSAVQHSDWAAREWKVVRRTKLEELLDAAYAAEHWLDACRSRWLFQKNGELGPDPTDRVKRICALYFPELDQFVKKLSSAQRSAVAWNLQGGQKLLAAGSNMVARQAVFDALIPTWDTHYQEVIKAIAELEIASGQLMEGIRDA